MAIEIIKTIRASGGDYTSRSAFEAAVPANLVTLDQQWSGVIDAFEDNSSNCSWNNYRCKKICKFSSPGQGHAGKWDAQRQG